MLLKPCHSLPLQTPSLSDQPRLTADVAMAKSLQVQPFILLKHNHHTRILSLWNGLSFCPHLCFSVGHTPGLSVVAEKLWSHGHQCPWGSHGLPGWTQYLWEAEGRKYFQKFEVKGNEIHNKHPLPNTTVPTVNPDTLSDNPCSTFNLPAQSH